MNEVSGLVVDALELAFERKFPAHGFLHLAQPLQLARTIARLEFLAQFHGATDQLVKHRIVAFEPAVQRIKILFIGNVHRANEVNGDTCA